MKPPRMSIGTLLALIVVVALDLSIGRVLVERDDRYLVGLTLSGLVIQWGLVLAIFRRGSSRSFWIGFVLAATLAAASFVFYVERPESDSLPAIAWYEYARFIHMHITQVWQDSFTIQWEPDPPALVLARFVLILILFFLPQLFAALAGGCMLLFVSRVRSSVVGVDRRRGSSGKGHPMSLGSDLSMSEGAKNLAVSG